jgi:hypothetical protein
MTCLKENIQRHTHELCKFSEVSHIPRAFHFISCDRYGLSCSTSLGTFANCWPLKTRKTACDQLSAALRCRRFPAHTGRIVHILIVLLGTVTLHTYPVIIADMQRSATYKRANNCTSQTSPGAEIFSLIAQRHSSICKAGTKGVVNYAVSVI